MKQLIYTLLIAFISCALGCYIGSKVYSYATKYKYKTIVDTVTIYDTLVYREPIPKDSVILRYKTISVPVTYIDTLQVIRDSISVSLPISQKHYADSTSYDVWISGYEPCLDSIKVYNKVEQITIKEKQKKWSIGIQGGIGVTPKSVQPYVGIGISYNLFSF